MIKRAAGLQRPFKMGGTPRIKTGCVAAGRLIWKMSRNCIFRHNVSKKLGGNDKKPYNITMVFVDIALENGIIE